MEQPAPRRRSDGSVRECLFFPVLERNEQERLEALMRRSVERSLQLDHRPKRWTWGGPTPAPAAGQEDFCETPLPALSTVPDLPHDDSLPAADQLKNAADSVSAAAVTPPTPDPPIRKRLSSASAALDCKERASPSPHRSPYRAPLSRLDHGKTSAAAKESGGGAMPPEIPQREIQGRGRGAVSPCSSTPQRRAESPATPTRGSSPRAQSKTRRIRSTNGRAQSPCTGGQYPPSPMRNGATTPGTEEEKGAREIRGHGSLERKASKTDTPERKMAKSSSRDLNVDRSAESPVTPTGKPVAGTTDAEEASRLLAERRRQARLQKELEEKQRREQEEEERLRLEELRKRQAEERARQEEEERRAAEERQRQEQERRRCEEEEKRQRERRWLELQAQLEKEREETEQQARREVERLRQERELIKLQEEQERLQRKKRIEEIMKRTRKTDTEVKKEAMQMEPPSPVSLLHPLPSPLARSSGVTQVNGQVGGQVHSTWLKTSTMPLAPSPVGPLISLGNLEVRGGGVDEFPDEVQSMDVSPIAKEDLVSIPEFSPVNEVTPIGTSNARALEDLMDLTGQVGYPKTSPAVPLGDCNKNLIEGFSSSTETQLIQSLSSASEKLNIQ